MTFDETKEMVERCTILRGVVGSTVHGLAVESQDDRDEMGICVEPWTHYFGLRPRFEQLVYRTQPSGARSGPGDLDLVIYSLAKWARLALAGNPTIQLLLFIPDSAVLKMTPAGLALRSMAPHFISRQTLSRYLGYMREQRARLIDRRRMPKRHELIERYGFDTKYAGHVLRLGYQGIELAVTGKLLLPMADPIRQHIVDVRTGKHSEADVLEEARDIEARLLALRESTALPPPNTALIEKFVIDTYREHHPHPL